MKNTNYKWLMRGKQTFLIDEPTGEIIVTIIECLGTFTVYSKSLMTREFISKDKAVAYVESKL